MVETRPGADGTRMDEGTKARKPPTKTADAGKAPRRVWQAAVARIYALACATVAITATSAVTRAAALCGIAYVEVLVRQNRRLPGEPPVVWSWVPLLGSAVAFGRAPLEWLRSNAADSGSDVFVATVAGERTAFVTDASLWPKVLREPASRLEFRSIGMDVTEKAFGVPRRDVADAFEDATDRVAHQQFVRCLQHPEHIGALTRAATTALEASLPRLGDAAGAKAMPLFATLAEPLWVATMTALTGAGAFATAACYSDFKAFDAKFAFLAGGAPLGAYPAAAAALRRLAGRFGTDANYQGRDESVSDLLRSRKALFEACEAGAGRAWDPASHGKIQTTMVWAAAANTIPAALWATYWLARDATARARVVADVLAGLRRTEGDVPAALDDDTAFPVVDAAISEALRLATASLTVRRVTVDDYVLPGTTRKLRKRDRVALYPPLVHFDAAKVGPDPRAFVLDRYLAEPKTPLMPFGGGISLCPGRKFARREIKAFLVVLLKTYDVALADPAAPVPQSDPSRVGLGVIGPAPGADAAATFKRRA